MLVGPIVENRPKEVLFPLRGGRSLYDRNIYLNHAWVVSAWSHIRRISNNGCRYIRVSL